MKTKETENRDERVCRTTHNLGVLAKEMKVSLVEMQSLLLACIETLLAGEPFLVSDSIEHLEDMQQGFRSVLSEAGLNNEAGGQQEFQIEDEAEAARDELINTIRQLPDSAQVSIFKSLLEQVRNGEVLAVA